MVLEPTRACQVGSGGGGVFGPLQHFIQQEDRPPSRLAVWDLALRHHLVNGTRLDPKQFGEFENREKAGAMREWGEGVIHILLPPVILGLPSWSEGTLIMAA